MRSIVRTGFGLAAGVLFNVESFREVAELAAISRETGRQPRVAVRVNPDFELKGSGMKMGGGPKQFGVDTEDVPRVLAEEVGRRMGHDEWTVVRTHLFGSYAAGVDPLQLLERQPARVEFEAVHRLRRRCGHHAPIIGRFRPCSLAQRTASS